MEWMHTAMNRAEMDADIPDYVTGFLELLSTQTVRFCLKYGKRKRQDGHAAAQPDAEPQKPPKAGGAAQSHYCQITKNGKTEISFLTKDVSREYSLIVK